MVIVYGTVKKSNIMKQLIWYSRLKSRSKQPGKILLAVYDGPPEDKPIFDVKIKGLDLIIKGRNGLNETLVQPFLEEMRL